MSISLRAKLFTAFLVLAAVMGTVTILATGALRDQAISAAEAGARQESMVGAIAALRALPFETEGLVLSHVHADQAAEKVAMAAELLGADTREALALSTLSSLTQGAERSVVADLALQSAQAADLRDRVLAVSTRNASGQARLLATQEMPGLRAEIIAALHALAVQTGLPLPAAQAEAALNSIAAAQKSAILNSDPAYVTGQLAAAALSRSALTEALVALGSSPKPKPGWLPLQGLVAALHGLDDRMEGLLRDGGYDTAETIYESQLRPLDHQRLQGLDGLAALMQTGRRAIDAAAQARAGEWQVTLIVLADVALVLGFAAVMLGLGKIGRGLDGAVRLAEQIAVEEVSPPAWVHGTLAGRLTAALVRISAGQTALMASLGAVAAGRPVRRDLPDRLGLRLAAVAELIPPGAVQRAGQVAWARGALTDLQGTLRSALDDGHLLEEEAGKLTTTLRLTARRGTLAAEAERHALVCARHLTSLIHADAQAEALAQGLDPVAEPDRLRRIA